MANTTFKIENGFTTVGNSTLTGDFAVVGNTELRGTSYANGAIYTRGTLTVNNAVIQSNLVPSSNGVLLGSANARFDISANNISVSDSITATANGKTFGSASGRFEVYATTVSVNGTVLNSTFYAATANNANNAYGVTSNGIIVRTGSGTGAARTINGSDALKVNNGDGVAGNPSISVSLGSGLFQNSTSMYVNASAIAIGSLPLAYGGTGGNDQITGINNLLPDQSGKSDYWLRSNGNTVYWAQGPLGYAGSIGTQGEIGYTGSRGDRGYTGSLGYTGSRGYTGSKGDQGAQGPQGYTGSIGAQGPRGYTGSIGSQGGQGPRGYTGSIGAQGPQGSPASATAPILKHVTSPYTSGGSVTVSTSAASGTATSGDVWIKI